MSWMHRVRSTGRLAAGFVGRGRQDAELDDELDFHIAKATERNVRRGMSRHVRPGQSGRSRRSGNCVSQ